MNDPFDERAWSLPGDDDFARLRAMVCDPGTVYVYWQGGEWRGDGWRVTVLGGDDPLHCLDVEADGREVWFHAPPDTSGKVVLETRRDGVWEAVAEVPFTTPTDRPRPPARDPRFGRPSGGAPGSVAQETPDIEDVFFEARLYHGRIWQPTDSDKKTAEALG